MQFITGRKYILAKDLVSAKGSTVNSGTFLYFNCRIKHDDVIDLLFVTKDETTFYRFITKDEKDFYITNFFKDSKAEKELEREKELTISPEVKAKEKAQKDAELQRKKHIAEMEKQKKVKEKQEIKEEIRKKNKQIRKESMSLLSLNLDAKGKFNLPHDAALVRYEKLCQILTIIVFCVGILGALAFFIAGAVLLGNTHGELTGNLWYWSLFMFLFPILTVVVTELIILIIKICYQKEIGDSLDRKYTREYLAQLIDLKKNDKKD